MRKKYIIIGAGVFAQRLRIYIEQNKDNNVIAFSIESPYIRQRKIDGIDVLPLESMTYHDGYNYILGIGYRGMGKVRRELYEKCKAQGFVFSNYIHPSAIISDDCVVGEGNIFLESVIIGPAVSIGSANLFFDGCTIGHDSIVNSFNTFCSRSMLSSNNVAIDNCFIGDCSYIAPYIKVESYALVGSNTVVEKDVKSGNIFLRNGRIIEGKSELFFDKFIK